jgi:hypothetical protein
LKLTKRFIKEVCIHEASHLFIAKTLGNTILGMEMNTKKGWARVKHSSSVKNDLYEAAIKVAGYLGDRFVSKKDVKFRSSIYASQITEYGIIFGDYDDFKMLKLTNNQERRIIRATTEIIIQNQGKIKKIASYFISRIDKSQNITIKKREITKLFKDLEIEKNEEICNKLNYKSGDV